jgi:hypothetical protein
MAHLPRGAPVFVEQHAYHRGIRFHADLAARWGRLQMGRIAGAALAVACIEIVDAPDVQPDVLFRAM